MTHVSLYLILLACARDEYSASMRVLALAFASPPSEIKGITNPHIGKSICKGPEANQLLPG